MKKLAATVVGATCLVTAMATIAAATITTTTDVQTAATATANAEVPSHQLSAGGEDLYEYEALLYHLYGSNFYQCDAAPGCHNGWFYRGYAPAPMADHPVYIPAFTHFGPSAFHLMPSGFHVPPSTFGGYGAALTINGRLVACNPSATAFLGLYGEAIGPGNLDCY